MGLDRYESSHNSLTNNLPFNLHGVAARRKQIYVTPWLAKFVRLESNFPWRQYLMNRTVFC